MISPDKTNTVMYTNCRRLHHTCNHIMIIMIIYYILYEIINTKVYKKYECNVLCAPAQVLYYRFLYSVCCLVCCTASVGIIDPLYHSYGFIHQKSFRQKRYQSFHLQKILSRPFLLLGPSLPCPLRRRQLIRAHVYDLRATL